MVYLDNAATTYPKPKTVINAMLEALIEFGANPGRSGHFFAAKTGEAVYQSRKKCAEFFGADVENVVFTLNSTHALNIAIKGIMRPGCHVITTDLEHNAVIRPLHATAHALGANYSVLKVDESDSVTLERLKKLIRKNTCAVVITAASNVTGQITPFRAIGKLCQEKNICFILDAAQAAGVIPIHIKQDFINILCLPGHKGLYGPMGTGLVISDGKYKLRSYMEGGTGSLSKLINQPDFLPDRFESGTINTPGAISLAKGIDFIQSYSLEKIHAHETALCKAVYDAMKENKNILLYTPEPSLKSVPVLPFNIKGKTSEQTASILSEKGFCLRGGFHCAFLPHKKIGTYEIGAVRFAPSVFTTLQDIEAFIRAIEEISR
jgi:cysteine desulfurase family protein